MSGLDREKAEDLVAELDDCIFSLENAIGNVSRDNVLYANGLIKDVQSIIDDLYAQKEDLEEKLAEEEEFDRRYEIAAYWKAVI